MKRKIKKHLIEYVGIYTFIVIITIMLLFSTHTHHYKYFVTAPGLNCYGVDEFKEDKTNQTVEFESNGIHYKFVGTYEIKTNIRK
jgi:hypothetical protein